MLMMGGVVTEWEWGWGSGGGWLCEADSWECGEVGAGGEMVSAGMDDDQDCEFDDADADAGADFGDFGF